MKRNFQSNLLFLSSLKCSLLSWCFLLILMFVGALTSAYGTDYYFSSSSGDDSRTSVQAQNSNTPWRSLDKLNSIANQLTAGDRVLFRSGDVFIGSILVSKGGNSGNPITYTSYGSGNKPVITSMVQISNWVSIGNGIYEADFNSTENGIVSIFSINDQLKEYGRYPNHDTSNDGYLTIKGVNSNLSIQGENLPKDFVGGEIVIRKNNWIIDRHEISYNSGNTVNFLNNPVTIYSPQKDFGYFVQNHLNTLDQFGEWAFSKKSKKLYGYFGSQNPNSLNVQVATKDNIVKINKYIQNITFSNLNLKGSNADILLVENSGNIQILNCQFLNAGRNAVFATATPDIVIKNSSFDYSLSGGLFFPFGTPRAIIEDNKLDHTMPFQGMANSSDLKGVGIFISSDADNSKVTRNTILNTGFNGIYFGGNYTIIKNNLIDNYCLLKQDGGGIYTYSGSSTGSNNIGREIAGNIVIRGVGAVGGSNINYKLAEGIYIDDNAMGVKIYDNTVSNINGKGLYIHNNKNIEVYNNLFYNMPVQLNIAHDDFGNSVRNISVENNQFSSVFENELPYAIASKDNDINQIGTSNNNYFLDPFSSELMFKSQGPSDGPLGKLSNLKNWTDQYGYETNSIKPEFNLQRYVVKDSTTIKESEFSSNLDIVAGVYNASSSLSSGISGGTWEIRPSQSSNGSAFIQIGQVSEGDEILIQFDTKSNTENQAIEVLLEKTFNQIQEGTIFNFVTSQSTNKVKILLKSKIGTSSESIVLRFPKSLQSVLIDNLKIMRVKTEPVKMDNLVFFQYNYSGNAVSYPLSGTYKNGKGEIFKGSVTIPAYGSVLLAKIEEGPIINNLSPVVSIVDPLSNQQFTLGDEILIKANATDPEGQVKQVDFYVNDKLVETIFEAPYEYLWNNAPVGAQVLTAVVTDSSNQSAKSEEVSVEVLDLLDNKPAPVANEAPSVSIVSPSNSQSFSSGQDISINTNASDPEGKISKVEFYYGSKLIGSKTTSPYQIIWKNAPTGTHVLKTIIFDDKGLSAESKTISVIVKDAVLINKAPAVTIASPSNEQKFSSGQSISIIANASDPEGKIAKVEFFYGDVMIGLVSTAPYQVIWEDAPIGTHILKTKVFDDQGMTSESSRINIVVNKAIEVNQAPSVSITYPSNGENFTEGQDITIKANASDKDGKVSKVEFYEGDKLISTASSAPYQVIWKNAPVGSHILKSKVYDDKGLTVESATISVSVKAAVVTNIAPSVSIAYPVDAQSFTEGQDITIKANASDPEDKIAWVEFYYGETMIGLITSAPYQVIWENAPIGTHVLKTKVFDDKGLTAESSRISVTVKSTPLATINQAPSISIVEPSNNQIFMVGQDITLKANASDPENKIAWVEFYYGETMIALVTSAPYEVIWEKAPIGTHVLKTKVFDEKGLTAESSRITVTVKATALSTINQAPSISIAAPNNNQSFAEDQDITFKANVSDPENKIGWVEFYYGETMIGLISKPPYQVIWKNAPVGEHVLKTKVFDDKGLSAESSRISVKVNAAASMNTIVSLNQAPSISIVSPTNNQSYYSGQEILIKSNAQDPENKIGWVEFFYGETMIGLVSNPPYQVIWKNAPIGAHVLKTKVFDDKGLTAESSRINVVVKNNLIASLKELAIVSPKMGDQFDNSDNILIRIDADATLFDSVSVFLEESDVVLSTDLSFDLPVTQLAKGDNVITVQGWKNGEVISSDWVSVDVSDKLIKSQNYRNKPEQGDYSYEIGPNPTSDILNVYLDNMYQDEDVEIHIYDMNGATLKVIKTITSSEPIAIDLQEYSAGIYLIRVTGKVFVYDMKRFVKL